MKGKQIAFVIINGEIKGAVRGGGFRFAVFDVRDRFVADRGDAEVFGKCAVVMFIVFV